MIFHATFAPKPQPSAFFVKWQNNFTIPPHYENHITTITFTLICAILDFFSFFKVYQIKFRQTDIRYQ